MKGEKALSPLAGVVLMILVTIAIAHILGLLPLNLQQKSPYIVIDAICKDGTIEISNKGGDSVKASDLSLVLNNQKMSFPDTDNFDAGETVTISEGVRSGQNHLAIVYIPTNSVIMSKTVVCEGSATPTPTTPVTTTTTPENGTPGFEFIVALLGMALALLLRVKEW
jgi:flagellin-like protein